MFNPYFQDELQFLRQVGPDFSRANPEIARFLADRGADPDVERVLEGVAFLCGRIRQKLDDDLPEITASIMSLLWPHYLRPIPSMSILEFIPIPEAMQAPDVVAAGAEVDSVPVDGTQCRYRTCWPTVLRPWVLADASLDTTAGQPVRLLLRFRIAGKATLDKLELSRVRLHFHGDERTAFTLYLLLAAHVEQVAVSNGVSGTERREFALGADAVAPVGLDRETAALPYPRHAFVGYRLLQEYFAFREKFLFVDLVGLDRGVDKLDLSEQVEVVVVFNRRMESLPIVSRDNIRLHCVPIVNLFQQPAEPIHLRHDRTRYLVCPSPGGTSATVASPRHLELFEIESVAGLVRTEGLEPRRYEPFFSFRHRGAAGSLTSAANADAAFYHTSMTPAVVDDERGGGGTDTFVSFVNIEGVNALPAEETISIELTCTNRYLPAALRALDIATPTDSSPTVATFRNLSKPTTTVAPPLGKALHWRLISHMSLNYVSLLDAEKFRELLRVYDFQAEHDAQIAFAHRRLLDGIQRIASCFDERMVRGAPLRGAQVELELNEEHFAAEGDAYLFAAVLDRFCALYATLNSYSQLTVRFTRSGEVYRFPPRWGEQITPAEHRTGVQHD